MDSRARFVASLRSVVLPLVAAAVILAAVRSMATTLAGGGPLPNGNALNADCFVYADVAGSQPARNTCPGESKACPSAKYLDCADGDPTCDQDATCNGTCVFRARVCFGLTKQAACTPPPMIESLHLNHRCPLPAPTSLQGSACGAFVNFDVALKGRNHQRAARRRCTARAKVPASVSGRVDNDVYVFRCTPCQKGSPQGAMLELTTRR
jgi:hypothetical protein